MGILPMQHGLEARAPDHGPRARCPCSEWVEPGTSQVIGRLNKHAHERA